MRWWKMGAFLAPRSISDNAGLTTTYKGWVCGCMREAHQNNPGHLLGNDKCDKRHDKPWPVSIAGYLKVHENSWFGLGGRRLPVFPIYCPYISHIFTWFYIIYIPSLTSFSPAIPMYSYHPHFNICFPQLPRIFLAAGLRWRHRSAGTDRCPSWRSGNCSAVVIERWCE
jgi:hypothetical protein